MVTLANKTIHSDVVIKWNNDNSINVTDLSNVLLKPFSLPFNRRICVALRSNKNSIGYISEDDICNNDTIKIYINDSIDISFMLSDQSEPY